MNLFIISVLLNLLLIIGQLNADEEFDKLTADNINIYHVGPFGKRVKPKRVPRNKDFRIKITDSLDTKNGGQEIHISAEGETYRDLENENDLNSFGVSEPIVRSAAALDFLAWPAAPIYYRRYTPWGDLFTKFGYEPVHVNLVFDRINLLHFEVNDVSIKTQRCENNSTKPIECSTYLSEEVMNSVSNTWSNSHAVKVGTSMGFDIKLFKMKLDFEYQYRWGESRTKNSSVKITSSASGSVTLASGEAITFTLMSRRGVWKAEVVYKAYLSDRILINYPNKLNKHHFYFRDLADLLKFDNIDQCSKIGVTREDMERIKSNYKETTEIKQIIEIGYFSNSSVVATNVFRL